MSDMDCASPSSKIDGEGVLEDTVFVAVGREVKQGISVLRWALRNCGVNRICIFHVHRPDRFIPYGIARLPVNQVAKHRVDAHRVVEREKLTKKLNKYLQICQEHGVQATKIYVEMKSVREGIVDFLHQKQIRKLVMGAAADRRYSRDMIGILSNKAKYVHQLAPSHCHIWFVCSEFLVHTRKATIQSSSVNDETTHTDPSSSRVTEQGEMYKPHLQSFRRFNNPMNLEGYTRLTTAVSYEISGLLTPQYRLDGDTTEAESEASMWMSSPSHSTQLSWFSDPSAPDLPLSPSASEWENAGASSPPSTLEDGTNYELFRVYEKIKAHAKEATKKVSEVTSLYIEELENTKSQRDEVLKGLQAAQDHIRKLMTIERSRISVLDFCSVFTYAEVEKATNMFDPASKISNDAYGSVYKGFVRLTEVAIKMPHPWNISGFYEFEQEVEFLCKSRHPNIVNLIGICPESRALIFEHYANGTLEDHLSSTNKISSLPWQTRLQIATQLCCALAFLHSTQPRAFLHGDLKPDNIHLDINFTCKLSGFITNASKHSAKASIHPYMDPEYSTTGELTTKSDVYSFGIVLLRLLTREPALGISLKVQNAMETDGLGPLLDPSAGWPVERAKKVAALALRCCEMGPERRPDLEPDVWMALK